MLCELSKRETFTEISKTVVVFAVCGLGKLKYIFVFNIKDPAIEETLLRKWTSFDHSYYHTNYDLIASY